MLRIEQRCVAHPAYDERLVLPFELRQKSRFNATLAGGEDVSVVLARGGMLRDGDCLLLQDGRTVCVVAAPERLLRVTADDAASLARAAYHLGNRHAAVEIGADFLQLPYDHVLADMLVQLGMQIGEVTAPFQPERGAYSGGHHHHAGDALRYAPVIHSFGNPRK